MGLLFYIFLFLVYLFYLFIILCNRVNLFKEAIAPGMKVEIDVLQTLAFQGIPDRDGLRAKYWRVLLNVLPLDTALWDDTIGDLRRTYDEFRTHLILDPAKFQDEEQPASGETVEIAPHGEHPLSTSSGSQWNAYFKDNELLAEIDKDVRRTIPDLNFFNQSLPQEQSQNHFSAIRRILFLYAKLNPGVSYVQGMNEVLAPIYYVNASDPDEEWARHAEADSFFCFTNLMSEMRDVFTKTLDKTDHGVHSAMARLMELLARLDPALHGALAVNGVDVQFFAFRWMTLLLSQEFELPDVIRIWDPFFADPRRWEFMFYFCCAMMMLIREELLEADFAESLKLLQNYPHALVDVVQIFRFAVELRDVDARRNK